MFTPSDLIALTRVTSARRCRLPPRATVVFRVKPSAMCAPDQRYILVPPSNPIRSCTRFTLVLAGTAIALVAAASGAEAATPAGAAAHPAAATAAAGPARRAGAVTLDSSAQRVTLAARRPHRTPRQIAKHMLKKHYCPAYQFPYLNKLWKRESGWNVHAENPYSGAYGIPQAVPGSKMASAGPDWQSSARTQIRWGLHYIRARYHSPRRAWLHELSTGWYLPDQQAALGGS